MKRILLPVLLSLVFCGSLAAQQDPGDVPASKADIQRYLEVMHSKEMMEKMVDAMAKPMHQMIHEQYMREKDNLPPDFEARMNKMSDEYLTTFPWAEMLDAMVPVYQKHFTKNDVDALVAFYSTPTGQKLIRELPEITAEAMQVMMPMLQKRMDSMTRRMQEEVAAMIRDSASKSKAAAPQKNN